jgi:GDSL-like Lipase/Acylhydrolase family
MPPPDPSVASQPPPAALSRGKRLLFVLVLLVGVPVTALLLIEGGSSLAVLAADLLHQPPNPLHAPGVNRYDTLLGWVGRPNVRRPDQYGPGLHVSTNALGFRGTRDLEPRPSRGRIRVVCSGDSFAFGDRVGDDETWCRRLEAREPRLETVNLGQSAYGADQAYLRYKRDGAPLAPALHVFTFIWDDLYRMQLTRQWGHDKPKLTLVEGRLRLENVPVPEGAYAAPRLTAFLGRLRASLRELRTNELVRRVRVALAPAGAEWTERGVVSGAADSATWRVAEAMLEELAKEATRGGPSLVVVHFPSGDDARYRETPWRRLARETAEAKGLHYLDLADLLAELPPERRERAYIPGDPHLSAAGHDWAADEILQFIRRTPELAGRLAGP